MHIKAINIQAVGGISEILLSFDKQMNIVCGPNGIGKTTILESIAHLFTSGSTKILKRNVKFSKGEIYGKVEVDNNIVEARIHFDGFSPEFQNQINGLYSFSDKIIVLKTNRTFDYIPLKAVGKDDKKEGYTLYEDSRYGVKLTDVKNWFVNRYLYSAHEKALTSEQLANLTLAKQSFSKLNDQFTFSHVEASSNEILVNTPTGTIYYEYLSSGFKSSLSIIFAIIKEIEYRFVEKRLEATNFDGIILIDELELHLHPEWQEKISKVLTEIFPCAQFIVTTHSPHIIQFAEPNQVIALKLDDDKVVRKELYSNEYGFQGWTIEEILTDVMDMQDTRTKIYNELMQSFQGAIDAQNHQLASDLCLRLEKMLHPQNELKKLLKFQLATVNVTND
ncbi:AAA family ATPase [Mucilaginibacter sp. CAU 1740]|uniref:AAA family ATPase n=1 Tax=Mucilaginibacter sp. CAU 1740 TaxID=3140365 RepID=UPI00325AFA01